MDECSNYKFIIIAKTKKTKNKLINSFRKKGILLVVMFITRHAINSQYF